MFIGGTGRSGTSILAHALAHHPDIQYYAEPRLFSDPGGLIDLATGQTDLAGFSRSMQARFRQRMIASLHISQLAGGEQLYTAAWVQEQFTAASSYPEPLTQAARLADTLMMRGADAAGVGRWLEKTPHTVTGIDVLHRMFGDIRYVHILRDPVASAASTLRQPWGPSTVDEFIQYYVDLMTRALHAAKATPASMVHTISLERLAADPEAGLRRVMEFCDLNGIDSHLPLALRHVQPDKANPDGWKRSLTDDQAARIRRQCGPIERAWRELEAASDRPARVQVGTRSTVPATEIPDEFGWDTPWQPSPWETPGERLSADDAQRFLHWIWRHHRPLRHLEIGTGEGWGTVAVLESTQATVTTVQPLDGFIPVGCEAWDGAMLDTPDTARTIWQNWIGHEDGELSSEPSRWGRVGHAFLRRAAGGRVAQLYAGGKPWDGTGFPDRFLDSVYVDLRFARELDVCAVPFRRLLAEQALIVVRASSAATSPSLPASLQPFDWVAVANTPFQLARVAAGE